MVKLDDLHYRLGTQAHHLILDGWGFGQMLQSLAGIYSALEQGRQPDLSAPSYIDFIDSDEQYRESPRYARDRRYWLDKYRVLPEPLLTPVIRPGARRRATPWWRHFRRRCSTAWRVWRTVTRPPRFMCYWPPCTCTSAAPASVRSG